MLLEDLQVALKVAEFRSITAAAASLDMRKATASAALKRVESALGVELFIRTTRQLRLSSAGERYIPQCEQALIMLDQARQNLKDDLDIVDGELSSSPAGKHSWGDFTSGGIGNESYIDTYVYGLTSSASSLTAISSLDTLLLGADGVISVSPDNAAPGGSFDITVTDADLNTITGVQEGQYIVVTNPRTGEVEQFNLREAGINSSSFIGSFTTLASSGAGTNNDAVMNVQLADVLTLSYYDQLDSSGAIR